MESKKIVIAGNERQARVWVQSHELRLSEVIIVRSPDSLRGRRFYEEDIAWVGSYYDRPDMLEIRDVIRSVLSAMPKKEAKDGR